MRKLNTEDVFKMSRLIKAADLKKEIRDAATAGKKENADPTEIGMDVIFGIIGACAEQKVEEQLYDLLAGVTEKKPGEIKNQSIETTVADIKRIMEENNLANFLKSAFKLSGKKE